MKTRNAQASLYDLMMAFMLFLIAFSLLNSVWTKNYASALDSLSMSEMESKTLQALNVLLKTQGYPKNWNSSNVEIIGLAERKNSISETKLDAFTSMDYSTAKEKLKLGQYDFRFEFDAQGEENDVNFGLEPGSEKNVVSLKRIVEFNGGSVIVYFKVFK